MVGWQLWVSMTSLDLQWSMLAGALLLLLVLAAFAQVYVGLRPLRSLEQALKDVREGRSQALQGHFPQEIQSLTEDFTRVLERHAATLARARQQASERGGE